MPKQATVRLGGPASPDQKLHITGYCPARQLEKGPLKLTVSVEGHAYPPVFLTQPDAQFNLTFGLPSGLVGKERMEVGLEVDRTFVSRFPTRTLGLVFNSFAIR